METAEEKCFDRSLVNKLKKLPPGCILSMSSAEDDWFGKTAAVVSTDQQDNTVKLISPVSDEEDDYPIRYNGQLQFWYNCT